MSREGIRLIAAIIAAVLVAGLLSACGGSESDSTESVSVSGPSNFQEADSNEGSNGSPEKGGSGSSKANDESPEQGGSGSAAVSVPLKVSGGGSEQFRTKGGDNSIQEFGEEADESELQEVAEAVHDFYVTRAEGDWAAACSYLSKAISEKLEQLAESSTGLKDKSCPSFLAAFTTRLSPAEWREITTVDAASLRHDGEQAFLIYVGAGGTVFAMPLAQEDGEWKVAALSAAALS